MMLGAYAVLLIGTFAFASGLPTPSGSLILNGLAFFLLATGMMCVVAVGFSALTTSKPGAIIALIAWLVVASPVLANIEGLGNVRDALMSQAIAHFSPVHTGGGHGCHRHDVGRHRLPRAGRLGGRVPRARRLAHAHHGRLSYGCF